jgi:hypothetical protein
MWYSHDPVLSPECSQIVMLCAYFKMLKYKLREQSWRLILSINDKTDEAQVRVTFVRNEGKTKKWFFSCIMHYIINEQLWLCLALTHRKFHENLLLGRIFQHVLSIRMDNCLWLHTANHLWFTGTGSSFFRRFEISTALGQLSLHCWPQCTIRTCNPLHTASLHASCPAHLMQVFMTIKACN